MPTPRMLLGTVAAVALTAAPAAAERINLILNWTPGADHAPLYFALDAGWYAEAGLTLTIDTGRGSAMSAQSVGVGAHQIGISEMGTAFVMKSQGADLVAVMALYANSPFTFYWLRSTGIESPADFPGRSIGNPPADAARVMWPAFAAAVGIPVDSVEFVNVAPQAKIPTMAAGQIDITSDFWNGHDAKVNEFGDDLGHVRWSELGINPYGNSFIVNGEFLAANPDAVATFVAVTQRAYAACVEDPAPCIDALLANASGLERGQMEDQWGRVMELMADEFTTTVALGYLDADQIAATYALVETYFELERPFDPATGFTSEFLDRSILMTAQ